MTVSTAEAKRREYTPDTPEQKAKDQRLLLQYRSGDKTAFDEIYRIHGAVIKRAAGKMMKRKRHTLDYDDLIQEGTIGFIAALNRVREVGFLGPYLYKSVEGAMQQAINRAAPIYVPFSPEVSAIKQARRACIIAHDREPSIDEIAEATGVDKTLVGRTLELVAAPAHLDLHDPTAYEDTMPWDRFDEEASDARIDAMLSALDPISRKVIERTVLSNMPIQVVASELDTYHSKIGAIRDNALEFLRLAASDDAPVDDKRRIQLQLNNLKRRIVAGEIDVWEEDLSPRDKYILDSLLRRGKSERLKDRAAIVAKELGVGVPSMNFLFRASALRMLRPAEERYWCHSCHLYVAWSQISSALPGVGRYVCATCVERKEFESLVPVASEPQYEPMSAPVAKKAEESTVEAPKVEGPTKLCNLCHETKSVDDFHKRTRRGTEILQPYCKSCKKVIDRKYAASKVEARKAKREAAKAS